MKSHDSPKRQIVLALKQAELGNPPCAIAPNHSVIPDLVSPLVVHRLVFRSQHG